MIIYCSFHSFQFIGHGKLQIWSAQKRIEKAACCRDPDLHIFLSVGKFISEESPLLYCSYLIRSICGLACPEGVHKSSHFYPWFAVPLSLLISFGDFFIFLVSQT